nr:winged helix-turn-helix domain-containing protein [Haloplanus natans]
MTVRTARQSATPPAPSRWAGDLFLGRMTDDSVADDPDLATLVDLLDDEHVRTILAATSAEPLSAAALSDRCGVSTSAVYRRVDRLVDADLLDERTRPRSDGHHDTVYVATLERFELRVVDGAVDWTVDRANRDVADELTRLWGKF